MRTGTAGGRRSVASEFNFEAAAAFVRSKVVFPEPLKKWSGASIDTRTLKSGDVFFALKGTREDGHDHLWGAFRKGASGAVIREEFFKRRREELFRERTLFHNLIPVSDPEEALGALSGIYRKGFSCLAVGVTGSVGKTSIKEFLRYLLGQKYPVLASPGNFNNQLGLPLTLFGLKPEHQYCIAELGANHRGEIRRLSSLLKPRVGIITGVSAAHLEGFGSMAGIYEAKLELAEAVAKEKGTLILPDSDPPLIEGARKRKANMLFFGTKRDSDFRLTRLEVREGWVAFEVNDRWEFRFRGHASFQAENALAAVAASFACGAAPRDLPPIWTEVEMPKGRFQILRPREDLVFVDDGYNANPYAFEKSLEAFEALEGHGRKILVLGDMLELGPDAGRYHQELGEKIRNRGFQGLLTIGEWMKEACLVSEKSGNPPLTLHFEDRGMLVHFLTNFLRAGDQVLFKGSRAMRLEEVIHALSRALPVKRPSHRL